MEVTHAVIAGWTGRDPAAVEKHIAELEELGVKRPPSTPVFYRISATRISVTDAIECVGGASSGEVEFVLAQAGGALLVGAGSDHTDRKAETYNVTASKQMCEKPVAGDFWQFDDVKDHWDQLILRSFVTENDTRTLYQEGNVSAMIAPLALIERYAASGKLEDGSVMFCGTLAARGGVRPAPRFDFELEDPVLKRKIAGGYSIVTLPDAG